MPKDYNQLMRNRARARIEKLETKVEEAGYNAQASRGYQEEIARLRSEIIRSKKGVDYDAKSARRLEKMSSSELSRRNRMARTEMGEAIEEFGTYSKEEREKFFKATQRAWQGADYNKRYEAIMDYYGISDLKSFISAVLEWGKYHSITTDGGKRNTGDLQTEDTGLVGSPDIMDIEDVIYIEDDFEEIYSSYVESIAVSVDEQTVKLPQDKTVMEFYAEFYNAYVG